MPYTKFRKKPVVIDAVRYDGKNLSEILDFAGRDNVELRSRTGGQLMITTLEGEHIASVGDWIIRGVKGEFYPCKPDIFEATYEEVNAMTGGRNVRIPHPYRPSDAAGWCSSCGRGKRSSLHSASQPTKADAAITQAVLAERNRILAMVNEKMPDDIAQWFARLLEVNDG